MQSPQPSSRLVVGAAGMLVVQPAPMLIAELAYPTHRGKYTSAFWTMYYLGAILASWYLMSRALRICALADLSRV